MTRTEDIFNQFINLKLIKNQIENSADINEVRKGFQELCGMFELSNIINSLLIQKFQQHNQENQKITQQNEEIKRLNDKMLETEIVLRNTCKINKKLQRKIEDLQSSKENATKLKNQLAKSCELIHRLQTDQESLQLKLAKQESYRIEIAKLKSDNDDLSYQVRQLTEKLNNNSQHLSTAKHLAKQFKSKLIKNKQKFQQLKERYDLIKQNEKDNGVFTYIAMIADSLGTKISGIDIKNDVDHICQYSSNLKRALSGNPSQSYPLKQKFDNLTKDILEFEEYARQISFK
ncbi:hypothetical protein TVAG_483670 [Trichomonas vaginalis G3]|uniref:Uncharacterized protein n=1 Tax=Trichomonas vaginalis (strain ATCC PRA-98 / G3) TaxID=412133 RepID=A2EA11_TRIV3|nr:hypothetical protein TVAGG3_0981220 [Trichomonas vaginalis G3]EAY10457.1 hypothetical protein TVAG_483670 [Trichomonas vaginalis G3]KAI5489315.1 hypothetical protein TVAGG3_0981220 [Trichomonas vaginalis G3]|eukprot:XP_001322680.1 hypothetical protein [Trichomonas vaginalis G3]